MSKRKRKQLQQERLESEQQNNSKQEPENSKQEPENSKEEPEDPTQEPVAPNQQEFKETPVEQVHKRYKKEKQVYTRVSVDPSRQYYTPESRESWGPNVKGKKFRKEKGKKKRCPNAGVRIDGAINSFRLDT